MSPGNGKERDSITDPSVSYEHSTRWKMKEELRTKKQNKTKTKAIDRLRMRGRETRPMLRAGSIASLGRRPPGKKNRNETDPSTRTS